MRTSIRLAALLVILFIIVNGGSWSLGHSTYVLAAPPQNPTQGGQNPTPLKPQTRVAVPAQTTRTVPNTQRTGTLLQTIAPPPPLRGWVDLHAHLMGHLGFGGKLLYGGPDAGSWLPADPDCKQNVRATSEAQALGHDRSTHGGPVVRAKDATHPFYNYNPCGNVLRGQLIHALQQQLSPKNYSAQDPPEDSCGLAYATEPTPNYCADAPFSHWPTWDDLAHQRMWVEWIRRAYQGGLRVLVALAVNNKTFGDLATFGLPTISEPPVGATWDSIQGQNEDLPTDDKTSADIQISEIKSFVARHSDFMEVALSSADVYRIVSANKLAVVIGMEIDHIGNFGQAFYSKGLLTDPREWPSDWAAAAVPPSNDAVKAEIDRLYGEGVRYIFPIHLLDNAFGGTAAYVELFNVSTLRESGHILSLACTNSPADNIDWTYNNSDTSFNSITLPFVNVNVKFPTQGISYPPCANGSGHKNSLGLTATGITAVTEMMRLGMLIDIDHMSEASQDQALQLACYGKILSTTSPYLQWFAVPGLTTACPFGYPMNSGHSGARGVLPGPKSERSMRPDQYAIIGYLHGMAGVGSANLTADKWLWLYDHVIQDMQGDYTFAKPYDAAAAATRRTSVNSPTDFWAPSNRVAAGFGTDFNGLELAMPPRPGSKVSGLYNSAVSVAGVPQVFAAPSDPAGKTWNYDTDGVAHYGLLWDFLEDVRSTSPLGKAMVDNNFMYGADYFYRTLQIAEELGKCVQGPDQSGMLFNSSCVNGPQQAPPPPPPLSATVCPSLDGKSCTSNAAAGKTGWDIVAVTSRGTPVGGATVTTNSGFTGVTDSHGVAAIPIYRGPCFAPGSQVPKVGQTTVPTRTPVPCPEHTATVIKQGYQSAATGLP